MKSNKGLLIAVSLFLSLSITNNSEARIITVDFDVRLTSDSRSGIGSGCTNNQTCYVSTSYNQIIPISMMLEVDNPIVTLYTSSVYGNFGKPHITSPLDSIWGEPSDYTGWPYSNNSFSSFSKSPTGSSSIPYITNTSFVDEEKITLNTQIKLNRASLNLANAFFDYDLIMNGDELINHLNLQKSAIYNAPFSVSFSSMDYYQMVFNGALMGIDYTKPYSIRNLSGEARVKNITISEVPLPPTIIFIFSGLLFLAFLTKPKYQKTYPSS